MSRVRQSFSKAGKALQSVIFPSRTYSQSTYLLPNTQVDFRRLVGDGSTSSIVQAVVGWSARTFPEAPVQVHRQNAEGDLEIVRPHPMVQLIERPNPYYSGVSLWMATRTDWLMNGNAYWLKVRETTTGRVEQLWWLPTRYVEPWYPQDGSAYIDHYAYAPTSTGKPIKYPPSEIVHFRYGLDPLNPRKGISPLASVLREVYTDEEAAQYTAVILKNLGIPGLVISPKLDSFEVTDEDAEDIKAKAKSKFGGDNRGDPMIMQGPVDVSVLGWNPAQLDLKALRRIPEERVSAIFGVAAIVVGLGAGLDRSTFANFEEARQAAYESHLLPDQRLYSAELRLQLLPDFGDPLTEIVSFDTTDVRVLQDDLTAVYQRAGDALTRGAFTVNDYLRAVGEPEKEDGDVYLRPLATLAIPEGGAESGAAGLFPLLEHKAARSRTTSPTARLVPSAQRALSRFLAQQGKRTEARMADLQGDADLDAWTWPESEKARLAAVLLPYQKTAAEAGWDDGLERVGAKQLPDDAATARMLRELGTRITGIDDTTRLAIVDAIRQGIADGLSWLNLSKVIAEIGAFQPPRAQTIARTEIANAQNIGAIAAWEDSGIVKSVEILDGDECGWETHDDPDLAHGSVRTLDDFREHTLAHPNCVRVALPVVE